MTDHLDSAFLETFKTMLAKPALFIGTDHDTPRTRKKLLFLAAEYTAKSLGYQYDEAAVGVLKEEWIKTRARAFKRSALAKKFWRTWPMGTADDGMAPHDPDNPMSFFTHMEKKDRTDAPREEELAEVAYDDGWFEELADEIQERRERETYSFEQSVHIEPTIPFSITGVEFKSFNGTDVVIKNAEDKYATPIAVKMSLPEGEPYTGSMKTRQAQDAVMEKLMLPLNSMIGLDHIKETIEASVRMALMTRQRKEAGLKTYPLGGHMIFSGNPGTGKTHTARLVANILYQAGILQHGHLIEVDRAALVGEYLGQTDAKTNLICRAAQGGVLFIDEAYALTDTSLSNDYGHEAINILNKRLEDDAQNFIVIAAGYKNEMENFLRSNPGLRSRFHHTVEFRDYTHNELAQIFEQFAQRYDYALTPEARERLLMVLTAIKGNAWDKFGNARGARKLFEQTIKRQSRRLMTDSKPVTAKRMREIIPDDIPSDHVLHGEGIAYLPNSPRQ